MNNENELEITPAQKRAGNIIAGAYTVICGVLLLLVGLGVFGGLTIKNTALPTILLTIGLVFLTTAIIQKNSVSLWLAFAFVTPAVVSYLSNFTALSYSQLYPLYIAIPAICSLFTMPMSGVNRDHIRTIIFFGVLAGIFALESSGLTGWSVVAPALVVFFGACIVIGAVTSRRSK